MMLIFDFSTTSRLHIGIHHHITRSSQHEDAIGFQRSNSIAMRCCRASFCNSAVEPSSFFNRSDTKTDRFAHELLESTFKDFMPCIKKHAVPKHMLQKNISHTMVCIGFQFFDQFISRCIRSQLILADACQKLQLFMPLLHPPNSLCRALPRLKHWDTYRDGATSDSCGDPLFCGRNQGFGTTGSMQRRVSGDSSTTTSSKKKPELLPQSALWPFCRLFLGCAAFRSDLCPAVPLRAHGHTR